MRPCMIVRTRRMTNSSSTCLSGLSGAKRPSTCTRPPSWKMLAPLSEATDSPLSHVTVTGEARPDCASARPEPGSSNNTTADAIVAADCRVPGLRYIPQV